MTNQTGRPTGTCPVCERPYTLLSDGRVARHGSGKRHVWPPEICAGWGELSLEELSKSPGDRDKPC